jgi:hypothetical protein
LAVAVEVDDIQDILGIESSNFTLHFHEMVSAKDDLEELEVAGKEIELVVLDLLELLAF